MAVSLCIAFVALLAYRGQAPSEAYTLMSSVTQTLPGSGREAVKAWEVRVVDGDTIAVRGTTIRLVGIDAPETGERAHCPRERELGARATAQLQTLINGGNLELQMIPCPCPPGTEGTQHCNYGRSCARLFHHGRDVAEIMLAYVLARPYVCGAKTCPRREPQAWCL